MNDQMNKEIRATDARKWLYDLQKALLACDQNKKSLFFQSRYLMTVEEVTTLLKGGKYALDLMAAIKDEYFKSPEKWPEINGNVIAMINGVVAA